LFVGGEQLDKNFALSARNIKNVDVLPVQGANVYDMMRRDVLVLSKDAVEKLEGRLA
jgi:large subunit ribosomal protein L4